jgi:hypothetical protein
MMYFKGRIWLLTIGADVELRDMQDMHKRDYNWTRGARGGRPEEFFVLTARNSLKRLAPKK